MEQGNGYNMPNQLKRDPTKTTTIRKRYIADIRRRFKRVAKANRVLIVDDDVFGLKTTSTLVILQEREAFRFMTNPQKIAAYRIWLQQQIDAEILTVDTVTGQPWNATYIESAYRKGATKAYADVNALGALDEPEVFQGGRAEFLRTAFNSPEALSKIELVSTRAFEDLRGVTATMSQQMSRTLATGMMQGRGPIAIARDMDRAIGALSRNRAELIARTETIAAHAEGQLDSFERLGVEEVGVEAEWQTAGDDLVCPLCAPLEGVVMPVKEARGLIPRHPRCRCSWAPAEKLNRQKGQLWGRQRERALKKSVGAERKSGTLAQKKRKSTWLGIEKI